VIALLENAIKQGIDTAIERISREITVAFQHEISSSYQGPLPPPEMLGQFERVVPGLGRQIVDMAAKEQSHRHSWERRALLNDLFMQFGALGPGWILVGGALIGAYFLGMADHPISMGVLLSVPVIQMVRTIVGREQCNKEPVPNAKTFAQKPKGRRR